MSKQPEALRLAEMLALGYPLVEESVEAAEELVRQHALIEGMREAIRRVLIHRHDTPTTGYLRDNDSSRLALHELAAMFAKAEAQQ